jgi:hypothetical protein
VQFLHNTPRDQNSSSPNNTSENLHILPVHAQGLSHEKAEKRHEAADSEQEILFGIYETSATK